MNVASPLNMVTTQTYNCIKKRDNISLEKEMNGRKATNRDRIDVSMVEVTTKFLQEPNFFLSNSS